MKSVHTVEIGGDAYGRRVLEVERSGKLVFVRMQRDTMLLHVFNLEQAKALSVALMRAALDKPAEAGEPVS